MLFLGPIVMLFAILSDLLLLFADKWTVLRMHTIDRQFTIKHLNFMTSTYIRTIIINK